MQLIENMTTENETCMAALKFFSGEDKHVCKLCFSSTKKWEINLDDCVMLVRIYCSENLNFYDMFTYLGVNLESSLPHVLCLDCATLTINSYLFQKLCNYSKTQWNKVLNLIEEGLSLTDNVKPSTQSLYLFLNTTKPSIFCSKRLYKEKRKASILQSITNITKTRHNKNNLICEDCGKTFESPMLLLKHSRIHNKSDFMCQDCGKMFLSLTFLENHIRRVHTEKLVKCSKCNKMFSDDKYLKQHYRMHHEPVKCKICYIESPSRIALRTHLNLHGRGNKCPKCNKILQNKYSFKFHLTICGVEKRMDFFCDICGKGYIRKNGLRSHIKKDHGFGKVYICRWCGKKFDAISQLKLHTVKHTKERNFYCEYCGGKFVTHAALTYHTRLHTGEKPYQCQVCQESFISASRRMEHMKRKHLAPQQECSICKAKFVLANQLKRHMAKHDNPHSKLYVPKMNNDTEPNESSLFVNEIHR